MLFPTDINAYMLMWSLFFAKKIFETEPLLFHRNIL